MKTFLRSSESLQKECLHFLTNLTISSDSVQEYFSQPTTNPEDAEKSGAVYLSEYMQSWVTYYDVIKKR